MTTLRDIDGLNLSPSTLNNKITCPFLYVWSKVFKIPEEVPQRKFKMHFGTENHAVDENFGKLLKAKGTRLFDLQFLKTASKPEIAKTITGIKMNFVPMFKRPMMLESTHNLSLIDAGVFIDLRKHFDGDMVQVFDYWTPLELEYDVTDEDARIHMIVDNLSKIPAKFKRYRNEIDSLIIKDLKPGKFMDGMVKPLSKNSDYEYGNGFGRQLTFYSYYIKYKDMPCDFVAGKYYNTGQYVVDKITGAQITPFEKHIENFWNTDSFQRRKMGFHIIDGRNVDRCAWCSYRITCRDTEGLMEGWDNGGILLLDDCVKDVKCKECGKNFIVFKRIDKDTCHECELKKEEKENVI